MLNVELIDALMKKALISLLFALSVLPAFADATEEKIRIAPVGRVLLDGGVFVTPDKEMQRPGVVLPDVSVGGVMNIGKWDVRLDVGFNFKQIGFRDVFFRYTFNDRMFFKIGHFHQPYGLQSATTNTFKVSMEQPIVNKVLNEDRQLGAMYEYADSLFFAAFSAHADTQSALGRLSLTDGKIAEGYGLQTRLAIHPICRAGRILQVGISGAYTLPPVTMKGATTAADGSLIEGEKTRSFSYSAPFPTRVFNETALSAVVSHARNSWSFSPELLAAFGPVALESQYYFRQVNRSPETNLASGSAATPASSSAATSDAASSKNHPYQSYGAYAIVRGLLLGGDYKYSTTTGALVNPGKGALELVGMYNYVNLIDSRAGIHGGRLQGFSATINWYINRFMILRLQYSHTYAWHRPAAFPLSAPTSPSFAAPRQLNALQFRLQVNF